MGECDKSLNVTEITFHRAPEDHKFTFSLLQHCKNHQKGDVGQGQGAGAALNQQPAKCPQVSQRSLHQKGHNLSHKERRTDFL